MANNIKNKPLGFTLIEMLVVIGILALISSIAMVAIDGAKVKARDARRKADIKEIQTALEMFYNAYGRYPAHKSSAGCFSGSDNNWASSRCSGDQWLTADPDFYKMMARVPKDPLEKGSWPITTGGYMYVYRSQNTPGWNGANDKAQYYDLIARMENPKDTDRCDTKCWRSYSSAGGSYCAGTSGKCGAGWSGQAGQVYAGR